MSDVMSSENYDGTPLVRKVTHYRLSVSDNRWNYADTNRVEIARHWHRQVSANPNYFDGTVYLLEHWAIDEEEAFTASFLRTDFKSYLYWRHHGFEAAGVWDAFGSGLVWSADGALVLGRQNPGNVNAGLSYPPSGFIDGQDIVAGRFALEAHVAREVLEETGLKRDALNQQPGYWVTVHGAQVSLGVTLRSPLSGRALCDHITTNLAGQSERELAGIHMVRGLDDLKRLTVPPYVKSLLEVVFRSQ